MKKKYIKKILAASIVSLLFVQVLYIFVVEPTVATAVTAPDSVLVTLNVTSGVSITPGADAPMSPDLGISANQSIGNSAWTVKTNSVSGYTLAVKADTAPALAVLADPTHRFFADYTEATGTCSNVTYTTRATCEGASAIWTPTPEQWSTVPGAKEFGYSAYGTDVPSAWGTGSGCGSAGVPLTTMNYAGFTTTDNNIASSNTVTTTTGTTTNICFAAEQNTVFAPSGTYNATITATASAI